jgi:hypothetical protein
MILKALAIEIAPVTFINNYPFNNALALLNSTTCLVINVISELVQNNFFLDVSATVVGGVLLSILFFYAREKLFPLPEITGRWYMEITTENTSYNPFKNMILRYELMIWREGTRIHGSLEKIYENSSTGEREYIGENRTRGIVDGYLDKKIFTKDRLILHVIENGHGRESTNFYDLTVSSNKAMQGVFTSMIASQDGKVLLQRAPF